MSTVTTMVAHRGRAVMYMKLQSALRTAMACTIVGCATLYGPVSLKKHVTFPAFAYVTAVLIVSDANLGDAIRGCWHALFATLQVFPLAMLSIRVVGLTRFSPGVAAVAVAVFSFLVALPESTHLMCKRIAFGQLVIVYVDAVIHRDNSYDFHATTHPLHVAASTALGAISALLALLLPYPRLAHKEVRKLCQLYAENTSERMNLYINALTAKNQSLAIGLLAKAKPLVEAGNKLLQSIILVQGGMVWERPWMRFTSPELINPGGKLQGIETPIRGMGIALETRSALSDGWANQDLNDVIFAASTLINLKLQQATCFLPSKSTVPEVGAELINNLNLPYKTILTINKDPSACFFLSCAQQLISDSTTAKIPETILEKKTEKLKDIQDLASLRFKEVYQNWIQRFDNERFLFALKCSLSLGLAVVAGLLFNKENGYWSGLTIAISFVEGRQALFTMSNARAQGTAIGSVYGVLGCFIFQKFPEIRFVALLPWIFFTSFLRHSRMYGQAGGISAVIGALLILGRNHYGIADQFAIYRLTEAVIGLCCFILVELLFQPNRASTLVKKQIHLSLITLQECLQQLALSCGPDFPASIKLQAFRQKARDHMSQVKDLKNFIKEAELEPNFWFVPFQGSSYKKVHDSLSNVMNILSCLYYSFEYLLQVAPDNVALWKVLQEHIDNDLDLCKETIGRSLRCLETLSQKPRAEVIRQENANPLAKNMSRSWTIDIERASNSADSLPQQSKKVQESLEDVEGDAENRGKMLVSLSAWGFCTSSLLRETKTAERLIEDLLHWEYFFLSML